MKQNVLYFTLGCIAIVLLFHPTPASAEGSVDSTVNMTVPVLSLNQAATISTSVTSTVLNPATGIIDYFAFYNSLVLGSESNGQISSASPTIKFSISQSRSISVIQIPVVSVSNIAAMGATLSYQIQDSQASILVSGLIGKYALQEMSNKGYLLLLLNSAQTSSTSVALISGETYSIVLTDPSSTITIAFVTSPTTTTDLLDAGVSTGYSVPLIFHDTTKLGSVDLLSGTSNLSFTPTFLFDQLLGYYDDPFNDYQTSFDLHFVTFDPNNNYTITATNPSVERGNSVTIPTILENNGVGVANTPIKFQLQLGNYYNDLGSYTTSSSGLVNFQFDASYDQGIYNLSISAEPSSDALSKIIQITITPPTVTVTGLTATGIYGSGADNSTQYKVSGYLENSQGLKISGVALTLQDTNGNKQSTTSSSTGYFELIGTKLFTIGTYPNYFTLTSNTTEYTFNDVMVDLQISLGQPVITLQQTDYSLSYNDLFSVAGNITDNSGDLLPSVIIFQIFNNTTWNTITTLSTPGNFSVTLPSDYTGQYTYRVKSTVTANYSSSERNFNAIIGKINAKSTSGEKKFFNIIEVASFCFNFSFSNKTNIKFPINNYYTPFSNYSINILSILLSLSTE